jgi:hypothetical protein
LFLGNRFSRPELQPIVPLAAQCAVGVFVLSTAEVPVFDAEQIKLFTVTIVG